MNGRNKASLLLTEGKVGVWGGVRSGGMGHDGGGKMGLGRGTGMGMGWGNQEDGAEETPDDKDRLEDNEDTPAILTSICISLKTNEL